jgi:hypothetical protein
MPNEPGGREPGKLFSLFLNPAISSSPAAKSEKEPMFTGVLSKSPLQNQKRAGDNCEK